MNILIIGNCQARPVSSFISALCPDATMLPEIIVHLESNDNAEKNGECMANADVIFAQLVQDNYPVSHLATSNLKNQFPNKVVVWPNAFYVGQSPNIVCLSKPGLPRVKGPLDVYHVTDILCAWQEALSENACIEKIMNQSVSVGTVANACNLSLDELKQRELSCDIRISDYIEKNWLSKKLFHVFNHPTNQLLIELSTRLCAAGKVAVSNELVPEFWPEALNRVVPPIFPSVRSTLGFEFECTNSSKGFSLEIAENGDVSLGDVTILPIEKLVELFYTAYDLQLNRTDQLTYTPASLDPSINKAIAA